MKKLKLVFMIVLVCFIFISTTPVVFGCELQITPEISEVIQNQTLEMIAYRRQIHKRCIINMDDIKVETINCRIDKQTIWEKEGSLWSKKLSVSFPEPGEATVKIIYDCEKHPGDIAPFSAKIIVTKEIPKEDPAPPPETPKSEEPKNPSVEAPKTDLPKEKAPTKNPSPLSTPEPTKSTSSQSPKQPSVPKSNTDNSLPIGKTKENLPEKKPFIQQSEFNMTPDPSLGNLALEKELLNKSNPTSKSPIQFFFDQSFYLLLMLLLLSMILYLLKQFKLRYVINLASLGILGFYLGGCICPIGMFERIGFLQSITPFGVFSLLLLGILWVTSLFFGRIFCGWICPQGSLQEILYRNKKEIKVSRYWHKVFFILPILVFLVTLLIPFFLKTSVFCKVDPFKIPFQQTGSVLLVLVFCVLALISIFFYRPFCRSVCPLGLFLGVGSWLGEKLHLRIFPNQMNCNSCSKCSKSCPVDTKETYHCIECGDCHSTCKISNK